MEERRKGNVMKRRKKEGCGEERRLKGKERLKREGEAERKSVRGKSWEGRVGEGRVGYEREEGDGQQSWFKQKDEN